eukprot:CAMPEP_0119275606 /NCGR_PEP_ID=MMETSP1329-20130426/14042_1 /TAXON_ID=114041 /ORGANISM="Genus nov. species nov., Strain RCC1024" /LENGTH=73 /DNA_ID=CAMNT_0007275997 /DNA_START=62 /DNA_END=279 /DNA_ORIENTATION=-
MSSIEWPRRARRSSRELRQNPWAPRDARRGNVVKELVSPRRASRTLVEARRPLSSAPARAREEREVQAFVKRR